MGNVLLVWPDQAEWWGGCNGSIQVKEPASDRMSTSHVAQTNDTPVPCMQYARVAALIL